MNNEQQQIIDEVYELYWNSNHDAEKTFQYEGYNIETRRMTKDEFIDMVKTDEEYGRRWGLKIEERELSEGERGLLLQPLGLDPLTKEGRDRLWKENNLPTKLITITYNNKTIESYECTLSTNEE